MWSKQFFLSAVLNFCPSALTVLFALCVLIILTIMAAPIFANFVHVSRSLSLFHSCDLLVVLSPLINTPPMDSWSHAHFYLFILLLIFLMAVGYERLDRLIGQVQNPIRFFFLSISLRSLLCLFLLLL